MNVHLHVLALDGVFAPEGDNVRFHRLSSLDRLDVAEVLATLVPGVRRRLRPAGPLRCDRPALVRRVGLVSYLGFFYRFVSCTKK